MADINQKNSSNRFVNPYNFIHLPEEKAMAYGETDRHTGVIHYTITTKTPLFVPNSSSETAFKESEDTPDHKSYDQRNCIKTGICRKHECCIQCI